MSEDKKYRTLTDVLNMPAGESEPIIMRAAPAISRVCDAIGVFDVIFSNDFIAMQSATFEKLPAKEQKRIKANVLIMGKSLTRGLLEKGFGDSLPDVKEVLAAVQGISLDELNAKNSTLEVLGMARELVTDKGFLSLVRTLA